MIRRSVVVNDGGNPALIFSGVGILLGVSLLIYIFWNRQKFFPVVEEKIELPQYTPYDEPPQYNGPPGQAQVPAPSYNVVTEVIVSNVAASDAVHPEETAQRQELTVQTSETPEQQSIVT
ncbi:hypothetical protein EDD86DRAFT_278568 [Gorgonomyces haynaldii]|nr:hypothetical protein EDD86DRAFT_278568 [Gorgonomyces haynaldii]